VLIQRFYPKKQIKPREVELALTYDSNNNPIINQRSSVLKSKSQEPVARREASPKKKPEPQSPARKRLYKNTEGSLERNPLANNHNGLAKKGGYAERKTQARPVPASATVTKVSSLAKDSKISTPISTPKATSPLRSPETSPRVKPPTAIYNKIIGRTKSPSAGSSQTALPFNNNKNPIKQPEHNKTKSLGKPTVAIEQPSFGNIRNERSPNAYRTRTFENNRTPTRSTKRDNSLHDYLTEDSITPSEAEVRGKNLKLNLVEENTKQPQDKAHPPVGNLKHFRYPSFGRGGLEKETKQLSTRRTISQEAQLPEITEVNQTPFSPTDQLGAHQPTQGDFSKESSATLKTNQSVLSRSRPDRGARKEPKIAYSSLMKSLELRKNMQNPTNLSPGESKGASAYDLSQVNTNILIDPNVDFLSPTSSTNNLMGSIYSGGSIEDRNKKVVDIYERNSRWQAVKDDRIQAQASTKSKQELQECTFKPVFQKPTMSSGSGLHPKNFYTPMAARIQQTSASPERSFSKEKKAFTSYREINELKKEVNVASPVKNNQRYYSPKSRFYAVGKAEV